MKLLESPVKRRTFLAAGVAAAAAWASRPLFRPVRAQQAQGDIIALAVSHAPLNPDDSLWVTAQSAQVPLNPQNLVLPRLKEAGAKDLRVRALYDADRIAFLLEWADAHRDVDLGTVMQYRDAVAIQFPEQPSTTVPAFTMGQKDDAVTIYHWKSDWEFARLFDVEESYPNMYGDWYQFSGVGPGQIPEATDYLTTGRQEYLTAAAVGNSLADPSAQEKIGPVQKMRAEGFGTIEPHPNQDAQGRGVFRDGGWKIVVSVPREQGRFRFKAETLIPVAFAVWDGSRNERNGQKAYSVWSSLSLSKAVPSAPPSAVEPGTISKEPSGFRWWLAPSLGGFGGLVVAMLTAVVGLRLWRTRRER
ncbi:MAG: ethylbenzene dehydrogenase-related protein [Dehalococcoidia bacterium]